MHEACINHLQVQPILDTDVGGFQFVFIPTMRWVIFFSIFAILPSVVSLLLFIQIVSPDINRDGGDASTLVDLTIVAITSSFDASAIKLDIEAALKRVTNDVKVGGNGFQPGDVDLQDPQLGRYIESPLDYFVHILRIVYYARAYINTYIL